MRNKIIIGVLYTLFISVSVYFLTIKYTNVPLPQNITKSVVVEKNVNKVKEKTTTKIDKAGNPVVVVEKTTDKSVENISQISNMNSKKTSYSLGVAAVVDINYSSKQPDTEITAGKRINNSDFWLEFGYTLEKKAAKVGLKFEF